MIHGVLRRDGLLKVVTCYLPSVVPSVTVPLVPESGKVLFMDDMGRLCGSVTDPLSLVSAPKPLTSYRTVVRALQTGVFDTVRKWNCSSLSCLGRSHTPLSHLGPT